MRRFYNPSLSAEEVEALDWANWLVVQSVQAFLGDISDNVLAIGVDPTSGNEATFHVALGKASRADQQSVEDALDDLDVLLGGRVRLHAEIRVERPDVGRWQSAGRRLIFLRKPE